LLGWRDVPVDNSSLGESVKAVEPVVRQVFIGRGKNCKDADSFERKLFVIRKTAEHAVRALPDEQKHGPSTGLRTGFYIPSFSSRTIVYKGMLLADQVGKYYLDLQDESLVSALALVHQRFSTTLPDLGSGASVPHDCAQRRDQHVARQRELDGGAPCHDVVRAARRGSGKAVALIVEGQSDSAVWTMRWSCWWRAATRWRTR